MIDELLAAYHNKQTRPEVKAQLAARLKTTLKQLNRKVKRASAYEAAHFAWLAKGLEAGMENPKVKLIPEPIKMPPGSPI